MNWVEQSGKSNYKAVIVTPEQAFKIMMALPEPERTLTLLIAASGLRISEALGLQWQDVDYANQRIHLHRKWADNQVLECMKTEASEAPATLGPMLAEFLQHWHQRTPYAQASDWIFASSKLKGRQPRTASILAADHLRPAAISAGVALKPGQRFGFHNLRHSLATFLVNREQDTKTTRSAPPRQRIDHARAVRAKREFLHGGSAGVDAKGDFAERFERGELNFPLRSAKHLLESPPNHPLCRSDAERGRSSSVGPVTNASRGATERGRREKGADVGEVSTSHSAARFCGTVRPP